MSGAKTLNKNAVKDGGFAMETLVWEKFGRSCRLRFVLLLFCINNKENDREVEVGTITSINVCGSGQGETPPTCRWKLVFPEWLICI